MNRTVNLPGVMIAAVIMLSIFMNFACAADSNSVPNIMVTGLKYDPYPIEAGKYMTLWIKIDNIGLDKAQNVTCELIPTYPFILDSTENSTKLLGILPALESAIIDYRIYVDSNAVEGNNTLSVECRPSNEAVGIKTKVSLYVSSNIPGFAVGSVIAQPSKLLPDTKDNKVIVKLLNIGDGAAELVSAKLIIPQGITPSESYSNVASIGAINAGSSGDASFYIDINKSVEPRAYNTTIEISYRDSNGAKSEYKTASVPVEINVRPSPIFEIVNITTVPGTVKQGDKVELKIVLKNTGHEEADSVSLRIYKQNDQPFELDEKYDYIGNLKSGESGQAGFKITIGKDASIKTHLMDGEIRYIVGNDVFVVNRQIPVQVVSGANSGINPLYIAVGLIALAVLGFYYVRSRKK